MKRFLTTAAVAVLMFCVRIPEAQAYQFWPNASEWASWPEYCRAKYSRTSIGRSGEYGDSIPADIVDRHAATLGRAWVFIHHHCAGITWLQRARLAATPRERKEALRHAFGESRFTIDRIPQELPIYAEIATHMGTVARTRGDPDEALKFFELAMRTHPEYPGGYQGIALVYQDQGRMEDAREILLRGDEATDGNSPEIHYFLGLALVRMNDYEAATTHARRAYELGYPLPGLRNKLAAVGHPID